jgi:hypothetical protein
VRPHTASETGWAASWARALAQESARPTPTWPLPRWLFSSAPDLVSNASDVVMEPFDLHLRLGWPNLTESVWRHLGRQRCGDRRNFLCTSPLGQFRRQVLHCSRDRILPYEFITSRLIKKIPSSSLPSCSRPGLFQVIIKATKARGSSSETQLLQVLKMRARIQGNQCICDLVTSTCYFFDSSCLYPWFTEFHHWHCLSWHSSQNFASVLTSY